MSTIKNRLVAFIEDIAKELTDSQTLLQKHIVNQTASSASGEKAFRDLQIAEAASHALNIGSAFVEGKEFAEMTETEVSKVLEDHIAELCNRRTSLFKNGLNERYVIDSSGVMQIAVGLERLLKRSH
jgi:hypothetical protein